MSTAWPHCDHCPPGSDTPARYHVRGGPTPAMDKTISNACEHHLRRAQQQTRDYAYRETRPAGPGDAHTTTDSGEQDTLFDLGGGGA